MSQPTSQEAKIAQKLAANGKKTRDQALLVTKAYLSRQSEIGELEMKKLWKGLYFCLWMTDKPLVQHEVAQNLADLMHALPNTKPLLYIQVFFDTMMSEWHLLDKWRLDKYLTLVRKVFQQSFEFLKRTGCELSTVQQFAQLLVQGPMTPADSVLKKTVVPLRQHLIDIYMTELLNHLGDAVQDGTTMALLEPFFNLLSQSRNKAVVSAVFESVFEHFLDEDVRQKLKVDASQLSAKFFEIATAKNTAAPNRPRVHAFRNKFNEQVLGGEQQEQQEEQSTSAPIEVDEEPEQEQAAPEPAAPEPAPSAPGSSEKSKKKRKRKGAAAAAPSTVTEEIGAQEEAEEAPAKKQKSSPEPEPKQVEEPQQPQQQQPAPSSAEKGGKKKKGKKANKEEKQASPAQQAESFLSALSVPPTEETTAEQPAESESKGKKSKKKSAKAMQDDDAFLTSKSPKACPLIPANVVDTPKVDATPVVADPVLISAAPTATPPPKPVNTTAPPTSSRKNVRWTEKNQVAEFHKKKPPTSIRKTPMPHKTADYIDKEAETTPLSFD